MRPLRWLPALALGLACAAPQEIATPADARAFEPPVDGCLRSEHLERYLTVLRRAAVLRREKVHGLDLAARLEGDGGLAGLRRAYEVAGGLRDLAGVEAQAAQELGFDPREQAWVAATLEEAELALAEAEMRALAADPEEFVAVPRVSGRSSRNGSRSLEEGRHAPPTCGQRANGAVLQRYGRALERARGGEPSEEANHGD